MPGFVILSILSCVFELLRMLPCRSFPVWGCGDILCFVFEVDIIAFREEASASCADHRSPHTEDVCSRWPHGQRSKWHQPSDLKFLCRLLTRSLVKTEEELLERLMCKREPMLAKVWSEWSLSWLWCCKVIRERP